MTTPRQLAGVWVIGSVITGTLAVLFTLDRGGLPFVPPSSMPTLTLVGVWGLVVALLASLGLLLWGTPGATWLPETARGRFLWVVLVSVAGLTGWTYAAAVTFATDFSLGGQLVLGYVAGGLPFALVAAMLLRSVAANVGALLVTVLLAVIGFLVPKTDLAMEYVRLLQLLVL